MHHRRGPAKAQHRLVEIRQGQVHRKQTVLLVLHLQNIDTAVSQSPQQSVLEHGIRDGWRQRQRRFLHEEHPFTDIHRIEEGGRAAAALRLTEVVAAIVHQHELAGIHRRR